MPLLTKKERLAKKKPNKLKFILLFFNLIK
jgi:hypothetical protein